MGFFSQFIMNRKTDIYVLYRPGKDRARVTISLTINWLLGFYCGLSRVGADRQNTNVDSDFCKSLGICEGLNEFFFKFLVLALFLIN